MCESELNKHQHMMYTLLKTYKNLWEKQQEDPGNLQIQVKLQQIQKTVLLVDHQQKRLLQQLRLKKRYEQQQRRSQQQQKQQGQGASLPSSPQGSSSSTSEDPSPSRYNENHGEGRLSPRLKTSNSPGSFSLPGDVISDKMAVQAFQRPQNFNSASQHSSAVDAVTPTLHSGGGNNGRRPTPPVFLDEDNYYLLEAENSNSSVEMESEDEEYGTASTGQDGSSVATNNHNSSSAMCRDDITTYSLSDPSSNMNVDGAQAITGDVSAASSSGCAVSVSKQVVSGSHQVRHAGDNNIGVGPSCEFSDDPQDIVTESEFMQNLGMLPSRQLPDLLEKRALRRQNNRHRLFFSTSATDKRDTKKKKKDYLGNSGSGSNAFLSTPVGLSADGGPGAQHGDGVRGSSPPSDGQPSRGGSPVPGELADHQNPSEGPQVSLEPVICAVCDKAEWEGCPLIQCGGCGCHYHQQCSAAPSSPANGGVLPPLLCCAGDPWLCGGCRCRGMRAPLLHDPLLLRNMRYSASSSSSQWGTKVKEGLKSSGKKSDGRGRKSGKGGDKKAKVAEKRVASSPSPAALTTAGPANNTIKTRGSANRRPPAKLMSPVPSSRQRPVNQLSLATRAIKILHVTGANTPSRNSARTSLSSLNGLPTPIAARGDAVDDSGSGSITISSCGGLVGSTNAIKIGKSARINLTKITATKINEFVAAAPPSSPSSGGGCDSPSSTSLTAGLDLTGNSPTINSSKAASNTRPSLQQQQMSASSVIKTRNVTGKLSGRLSGGVVAGRRTVNKDGSLVKVFRKLLKDT